MKIRTFLLMFLFGLIGQSCAVNSATDAEVKGDNSPFLYDLTTTDVGTLKIAGVSLYFGDRTVDVGGFYPKMSRTMGFFKTNVPYPTEIAYFPYGATSDSEVIYITDIKVEGELHRSDPHQTLTVEIDPDNHRAVCKVGRREGS